MHNYLNYFHQNGHDVTLFCYKQDDSFAIPEGTKVVKVSPGLAPKHLRRYWFNKRLAKVFKQGDFDFSLTMERTSQQDATIAPGDHKGFMKAMGITGRRLKHWAQVKMDAACFEHSEAIFPCSDMIAENLRRFYQIPNEKLCTLYPPLDVEKFNRSLRGDREKLRQAFGMSPQKTTFVMVSVSHTRKGVPLALEIFKHLPADSFELKIAGSPKLTSSLPNVEFVGYIKDTPGFFTAADFTLHPALFEPAGQIVAESLACGTPVVISEKTGWAPKLEHSEGLVISGFSPEKWAKELIELRNREFDIPEDFAVRNELTLNQHMEKMLSFFEKRTGRRLNR